MQRALSDNGCVDDARLWAAREDPGLQSELGGEYTRPTGGCHEHAARFSHPQGDRRRTRVKGAAEDKGA
eukprot:scaffold67620_cov41-Phaeocystis_antarctica.AAC.1